MLISMDSGAYSIQGIVSAKWEGNLQAQVICMTLTVHAIESEGHSICFIGGLYTAVSRWRDILMGFQFSLCILVGGN